MLQVEWSDEAQNDLAEIQFYIEQFNPVAAIRLRQNIETAVANLLPMMPYAARAGRIPGTREYVVHPNYIVVYRVTPDHIDVLSVIHARRQFPPKP